MILIHMYNTLILLLDNEPISEVNRALYLKCTHGVIDSLQVALKSFVSETDLVILNM